MPRGKLLIAQGGGPTAVINQSLVGAVLAARDRDPALPVYGARFGVKGIVSEDFLDLTREPPSALEAVAETPGAALGSTRDKPDLNYCQEIFRVCRAHGIGSFLYIGGNDSADTVRIVSEEASRSGYALRAVHVPKTIDNDLRESDHTPGFPSAAKFVAQAFAGADLDNAALPGVYVGVVMGRHAGFLTAAAAALRQRQADGPHLIYLPERLFDAEAFLGEVNAVYQKLGRCVVAVSEGIHDADGNAIATRLVENVERDAHGNVQLSGSGALADLLTGVIKDKLKIKRVRGDTFGYLQRSFLGCVSAVDRREAREVGRQAVTAAFDMGRDGSVAITRAAGPEYSVTYGLVSLESVAGKTRVMPDEFIDAEGNGVTDAFRDYVLPLLGADLPVKARLTAPKVEKLVTSGTGP